MAKHGSQFFSLPGDLFLAAPEENFSIWRAYWPDKAILDGAWKPPVVIAN